jgi:hypothetical protein
MSESPAADRLLRDLEQQLAEIKRACSVLLEVDELTGQAVELLQATSAALEGTAAAFRRLAEASDRHNAAPAPLQARPVEGEIDHSALSKEFIERFPNIRAALAK